MRARFAERARTLETVLTSESTLKVHRPQAGMFAMIDISLTGVSGDAFAEGLLEEHAVAATPGSSFSTSLDTWLRVALIVDDRQFADACHRIAACANSLKRAVA